MNTLLLYAWMLSAMANCHALAAVRNVHAAKIVRALETQMADQRNALKDATRIIDQLQHIINETLPSHLDRIRTLTQKLDTSQNEMLPCKIV